MDHQSLKPLKGASAREKTAFTLKTIKELVEEEISAGSEGDVADANKETAAEQTKSAEPAAPKTKAAALPKIAPVPEQNEPTVSAKKPKSFLGRLFGG